MPVVILTGATRGIGEAAAIALAARGAELALVGRDPTRVRAAAEKARTSGGEAPVREYVADLTQMGEVRRLAAELLEGNPRIAANSFHPGVIRTGFGKNDGALVRAGLTLAGPFLRSPESGASSLVWLALDPPGDELRGQYVEKERPVQPSAQAQDDRLAAELWERSEELSALAH